MTEGPTREGLGRRKSKKLPLSVNLMPDTDVRRVVEVAQYAEMLGCPRCWVYDEGIVTRDVYVTLAAIALGTDSIRIGPGITNPFVRHPGATAAAIATIDELSDGRAFVGLGAGGSLTLDPLAIERQQPVRAVADTIDCLRQLFAGRPLTHEGTTFSFAEAHLSYGREDIEIIMAARGPRMMQLAAEKADGFYLSYVHKDLLGQAVAAARPANDKQFHLVYSTMIVTTEAELEGARAQLTFRLVDSPAEVKERIGLDEKTVERIRGALGEGGPTAAAAHIKPEWVAHFAITGSPDECRQELQGLIHKHQIDEFQLAVGTIEGAQALIDRTAAMLRED